MIHEKIGDLMAQARAGQLLDGAGSGHKNNWAWPSLIACSAPQPLCTPLGG
jgi:hypothetical protein